MVLTDFGISKVPGSEIHPIDYRAHDGNYYITRGNIRIYDDAYSLIRMLDACDIPPSYRQTECYQNIRELVGVHQNEVRLSEG